MTSTQPPTAPVPWWAGSSGPFQVPPSLPQPPPPQPARPYLPPPPPPPRRTWTELPHATPQPYFHLLRTRTHRWWRTLLGLPLAAATFIVLSLIVVLVVFIVLSVSMGPDRAGEVLDELGGELASPGSVLFANVVLALLIPSMWAAVAGAHTERIGWLSSVARRIRWRMLAGFGLLSTGIGLATVLVGVAFTEGEFELDAPSTGTVLGMFFVVSFTTPLQAAAEEYAFRGYLSQAIASWIPRRAVAAVVAGLVSATVFAFAHGQQDAWLFADRFAFGLTASAVVLLTGGLEAAIAYHTMNNVFSFALATLTGSLETATSTSAPVQLVLMDVAGMVVFTGTVAWWTRRWPPRRLSAVQDELVGSAAVSPGAALPGMPGVPTPVVPGTPPPVPPWPTHPSWPAAAVSSDDPEWHAMWRRPEPPGRSSPEGGSDLGPHPPVG